jgi:glycine/sarcosine/dimethylglycine N-methyltransferase
MAQYSETVETARDYYNSESADNFYFTVWGGEDIHIGLYTDADEPILDASHRTVRHMAAKLALTPETLVLDIGAGYGGAARYLAREFGCRVDCLNLSEVQNRRNRAMNEAQGLTDRIAVVDGDFENLPMETYEYDIVWSQDAILHSGRRARVLAEVDRVLKPGGTFIFTDPMQADHASREALQPVLDRIHLDTMGSPGVYRKALGQLGFTEVEFEEMTHQLVNHYGRVHRSIEENYAEAVKTCSQDYIERMKTGLMHWVDRGKAGDLVWGIFVFRK